MKKNNSHKNKEQSGHAMHSVSNTKKGLFLSLILTGLFFVVELVVGLKINSVAVIADAAHNFSAAAGIGIALLATIFAMKPVSKYRTFGFLKIEMFAAWINGALLLGMAYMIFRKGFVNLLNPTPVEILPMIILSIIGLVIGGIPAVLLFQKQKTDINARGAFWHVMETVLGSFAVLLAALIIYFTGWIQADAVLGMLLAPILVIASWKILKESTRELLDLTPKNIDLSEIRKNIKKIKGVRDIHHVHVWNLTLEKTLFSAHVKIENHINHDDVLQKINSMLNKKYKIYFSTIQIEKKDYDYNEPKELDFH